MEKLPERQAFDIEVDFAPLAELEPQPIASTRQGEAVTPADRISTTETISEIAPPPPAAPSTKRSPLAALRGNLPMLLAGLGLFSGLIATIGLIIVSRNIAEGNQRIAALQKSLKQAPAVVAPASAAPASIVRPAPSPPHAGRNAAPATVEDVRALLFALRRDLASYQNGGGANATWVSTMRDSQAELVNRLNAIAEKVDRIDRRINGSRPASPADDRARPS